MDIEESFALRKVVTWHCGAHVHGNYDEARLCISYRQWARERRASESQFAFVAYVLERDKAIRDTVRFYAQCISLKEEALK